MSGGADESLPQRLQAGLAELGLELAEEPQRRLLDYLTLLLQWNRVYNLTAVRDPAQMLTHHILDSLAVIAPLRRYLGDRAFLSQERALHAPSPAPSGHPPPQGGRVNTPLSPRGRGVGGEGEKRSHLNQNCSGLQPIRLLDVGSGGGLPGVVIAICQPEIAVTCVDAVAKKAAFIQQAAGALRLPNLAGQHARVESLAGPFDLITARAFASLADFTAASRNALAEGGVWLAMKGQRPDAEIAALPSTVEMFHVEPLAVPGLAAQRCLVWLRVH